MDLEDLKQSKSNWGVGDGGGGGVQRPTGSIQHPIVKGLCESLVLGAYDVLVAGKGLSVHLQHMMSYRQANG